MTRLNRNFRCQGICHMITIPLRTTSKFVTAFNVLSCFIAFTLFYYGILRFSFAPCLPWQMFWHFKILARNPQQLRSVMFAYPVPCIVARSSRFLHGGLNSDCCGCWEHSVNIALFTTLIFLKLEIFSFCFSLDAVILKWNSNVIKLLSISIMQGKRVLEIDADCNGPTLKKRYKPGILQFT